MEGAPTKRESPESILVKKHGLTLGNKIALEKIDIMTSSSVPVGSVIEGTLRAGVEVGKPITFEDSAAAISNVKRIEERGGELLVHTTSSTYRLRKEGVHAPPADFELSDVESVETAKGSTYRYLPDGSTQRFKKVENREYKAQSALVYVPDYEWVKRNAPPEVLEKLGDNEHAYSQILLEYVQNPLKSEDKKVYIVDKNGRKIETNQEIEVAEKPIFLTFLSKGVTDFSIPVFHKPKVGFSTFDTRVYIDEKTGERMRERHLGNKVVKITLKQ